MPAELQEQAQRFADVGIVLDDEDTVAGREGRLRLMADGRYGGRVVRRGERESDDDLGSLARTRARRMDLPAVQVNEAADDGESKAETALMSVYALVPLSEQVEHPRQQLGGDADPRVPDPKDRVAPLQPDADVDGPAGRCELR